MMSVLLAALALAAQEPVKVFVLAGQSNMEGKGRLTLAESQSESPEFRDFYAHLKKDGRWVVRDDVHINYLERRGKLTVGFGSPGCIGPELEFGIAMGERFQEPVLLIKAAWGGRSLGRDFLPPSAAQPADVDLLAVVAKENADPKRKKDATLEDVRARYGKAYREMLAEVRTTLAELDVRFPDLKGRKPEIAGFVWFQGWNDHINPAFADAYAANLECLIRDVRKDLGVPGLPVVVGQMGQNGFKPAEGGMKKVKEAQAAAAKLPGVKAVATDVHWDADADKLIATWRQNKEAWEKVGSDFGYHYLGSVRTFCRIGRSFGEAMTALLK